MEAVQNISFYDVIVAPVTNMLSELSRGDLADALKSEMKQASKIAAKKNIDIDKSLKKALKEHPSVTALSFVHGVSEKDISTVIISFNYENVGSVQITGIVKKPSFFGFHQAKVIGLTGLVVNNRQNIGIMYPSLFLAKYIYGFKGVDLESIGGLLRQVEIAVN